MEYSLNKVTMIVFLVLTQMVYTLVSLPSNPLQKKNHQLKKVISMKMVQLLMILLLLKEKIRVVRLRKKRQ